MTDLIRLKFGMWVALARTEMVNVVMEVARGTDLARVTPKYNRSIF